MQLTDWPNLGGDVPESAEALGNSMCCGHVNTGPPSALSLRFAHLPAPLSAQKLVYA